jgi:hypothetical protein
MSKCVFIDNQMGIAWLCLASRLWAASAVTLDPPPGWKDVTAAKKDANVLLALKGPELSSFLLSRIPGAALPERAATRALLLDILGGLNSRTGLRYAVTGPMQTATYKNDLTLHYLLAETKSPAGDTRVKPKLVLGLVDLGDKIGVATLFSTVPETLLPSLIGSIKTAGAVARKLEKASRVQTLDGQLSLSVPAGTSVKPLGKKETADGMVLALIHEGTQLSIIKVSDPGNNPREEFGVVRDTLLSIDGVDPATISRVGVMPTKAGPSFIHASGVIVDGAARKPLIAGFLPWCYWGYSIFVQGPGAAELMKDAVASLDLGTAAVPKLVAATPKPGVARQRLSPRAMGAITAVLVLFAVMALGFRKR